MSVMYELDDGTQVAMMLASPAQARGWMADILHEGGVRIWPMAYAMRHGRR